MGPDSGLFITPVTSSVPSLLFLFRKKIKESFPLSLIEMISFKSENNQKLSTNVSQYQRYSEQTLVNIRFNGVNLLLMKIVIMQRIVLHKSCILLWRCLTNISHWLQIEYMKSTSHVWDLSHTKRLCLRILFPAVHDTESVQGPYSSEIQWANILSKLSIIYLYPPKAYKSVGVQRKHLTRARNSPKSSFSPDTYRLFH